MPLLRGAHTFQSLSQHPYTIPSPRIPSHSSIPNTPHHVTPYFISSSYLNYHHIYSPIPHPTYFPPHHTIIIITSSNMKYHIHFINQYSYYKYTYSFAILYAWTFQLHNHIFFNKNLCIFEPHKYTKCGYWLLRVNIWIGSKTL